jgi:DNA repair exonuclease SbcCD ATPase subunit
MIFHAIFIEGFKSYSVAQQFPLPVRPGFYLLSGRNTVDAALEGNGAGKSTIWDALCWALYGRRARGVRAGDVVAWGRTAKPGCRVAVDVSIGQGEYRITRTQTPNSLMVAGGDSPARPMEQAALEELLGLNYTCFLHTVLMGQFNPFFFDLPAAGKLSLFSEILDLQLWLDSADRAKVAARGYESQIQQAERKQAEAAGQITAGTAALQGLQEKAAAWDKTQAAARRTAEAQLATLEKDLTDATAAVTTARGAVETAAAGYGAATGAYRATAAAINALDVKRAGLDAKVAATRADIARSVKEIAKFEAAATAGACPYCNQPMSPRHCLKEQTRLAAERAAA